MISVLVPAYDEEDSIGAVLERVLALPLPLEIIVVDDGSTDRTAQVVAAIDDPRLRLIRQPENLGKTAAIERAIAEARGTVVVIQDADLEYDPAEIPFLVAPILEDRADVVYGSRFLVRRAARVLYYYHFLANHVLTFLSNLFTNLNLTDVETGYKAFRRDVVRGLPLASRGFGLEIELTATVAQLPLRVYEVPISYYGRTYAEGKKIGLFDGLAALWYIVYFNTFGRLERRRRIHRERVATQFSSLEPQNSANERAPGTKFAFGVVYFACAIAFLVLISRFHRPDVGFTPMVLFGDHFQTAMLPELGMMPIYVSPGSGYDGQFYAQLAARPAPWTAEVQQALDAPWYRSGRILPSLVASAIGLGHPVWAVQAYAAQYVAVWLLLAVTLLHWFPPRDLWNLVGWGGFLFSAGTMMAVCRALPDAWAMLPIAAGFCLRERGRPLLGATLLGVAGLARETSVLTAAGLVEKRGGLRRLLASLALAVLPVLVWIGSLRTFGGVSKVVGAFEMPFVSYWQRLQEALSDDPESWLTIGTTATLVALAVQAAFFLLRWRPSDWRWRVGIIHVLLMSVLGPAVWEGFPGAASRAVLPLLFAFNLSVPRRASFWPVLLIGNVSALTGLLILMNPPM